MSILTLGSKKKKGKKENFQSKRKQKKERRKISNQRESKKEKKGDSQSKSGRKQKEKKEMLTMSIISINIMSLVCHPIVPYIHKVYLNLSNISLFHIDILCFMTN